MDDGPRAVPRSAAFEQQCRDDVVAEVCRRQIALIEHLAKIARRSKPTVEEVAAVYSPIFAKDWRENAVDFSKPYQGHLLCMHGCGRRMHLRNTSATLNTWQMEICHVLPQGRLKLSDGDRSGKGLIMHDIRNLLPGCESCNGACGMRDAGEFAKTRDGPYGKGYMTTSRSWRACIAIQREWASQTFTAESLRGTTPLELLPSIAECYSQQ